VDHSNAITPPAEVINHLLERKGNAIDLGTPCICYKGEPHRLSLLCPAWGTRRSSHVFLPDWLHAIAA